MKNGGSSRMKRAVIGDYRVRFSTRAKAVSRSACHRSPKWRPRQVADDEAAAGTPEGFAFRQSANVAQAFGHGAQAWAKYQCLSHARIIKGTADDSPS